MHIPADTLHICFILVFMVGKCALTVSKFVHSFQNNVVLTLAFLLLN